MALLFRLLYHFIYYELIVFCLLVIVVVVLLYFFCFYVYDKIFCRPIKSDFLLKDPL